MDGRRYEMKELPQVGAEMDEEIKRSHQGRHQ
jgi:hypothetical protein